MFVLENEEKRLISEKRTQFNIVLYAISMYDMYTCIRHMTYIKTMANTAEQHGKSYGKAIKRPRP